VALKVNRQLQAIQATTGLRSLPLSPGQASACLPPGQQ
jgi:hypothetical protein